MRRNARGEQPRPADAADSDVAQSSAPDVGAELRNPFAWALLVVGLGGALLARHAFFAAHGADTGPFTAAASAELALTMQLLPSLVGVGLLTALLAPAVVGWRLRPTRGTLRNPFLLALPTLGAALLVAAGTSWRYSLGMRTGALPFPHLEDMAYTHALMDEGMRIAPWYAAVGVAALAGTALVLAVAHPRSVPRPTGAAAAPAPHAPASAA